MENVKFISETHFKQTEIGEIPEEWEVVRLGEIFTEVDINTRKVELLPQENCMIIIIKLYAKGIQLKEIKSGKKISAKYIYWLKPGDFIFSKINLRKGSFGFVPQELNKAVVSTEHPILELNTLKANPEFIKYYFTQPFTWESFKRESKGFSGKERIKVREFITFKIPLPPLKEQKAIAFVLSIIQEAKEKTERVIEATRELKKSLMKHLFTYGPVSLKEAEKVKLKETEIGMIPEEWGVVRLGEVANLIMGQSPLGTTYNENGEGFPFLQGKAEFGELFPRHVKFTTDPKKIAPKYSILMSVRAPVGDVNIANIDYCIGRGLASISLMNGDNIYIFYVLTFLKSSIEKEGTGSTFKAINKSQIENLKIPLPPLPVQQKIAEILSAIDEKIQAEERKKQAIENLFKSMLYNLMSGKIRIERLDD